MEQLLQTQNLLAFEEQPDFTWICVCDKAPTHGRFLAVTVCSLKKNSGEPMSREQKSGDGNERKETLATTRG